MRSLDTVQEERSKAASFATIPLVKLTTYSDRDAKTEGDIFYFSDRTIQTYDYDNTGTQRRFEPWLLSLGALAAEMTYIPHAAAGELLSQSFSLTLRNMLWPNEATEGERVIELLRENYPLEMATLEIAQINVPRYVGPYPVDLSAYDGDEHTVFHRCKVSRLGPITDAEIQIQCTVDNPEIDWNRPDDPTKASPRDLGTRYPRPYGAFTDLPLVAHTVGWATTLAQSINATQTGTVTITNGTGLGSSGSVLIEGEECDYSAATDTSMTISARGDTPATHNAGVAVIELISEMILVAADEGFAPINDITQLYVRNPFNGQLVRVTTSFEFDASDTVDGLTLSTVKMSQAQLREMYEQLYLSARITVQPSYGTGAAPSSQTKEPSTNGAEVTDAAGKNGIWTKPALVHWNEHGDAPHRRWDEDFAAAGFDNAKDVLRWRLTLEVKNTQEGGYDTECRMTLVDGVPGIAAGSNIQITIPNTLNDTDSVQSAWFTPPSGTYLSALHSKTMSLIVIRGTGADEFDVLEWGVEAELDEGGQVQQDVPAESVGAGFGYDHEFYADGEGAIVPDNLDWDEVYDFDTDAGWNADAAITRSTDSGIKYPGSTASQKLILAATTRVQCESADSSEASQWNSTNATVADEASIKTEGAGSIKGASTSAAAAAQMDFTLASPVDLTAGEKLMVNLDVYLDKQGASGGEIQIRLGSDAANYDQWNFTAAGIADQTWQTLVIDYEETPDDGAGSFNGTGWDYFEILWNTGATQVVGFLCYVDFGRTIPKYARVQKNDLSSVDMTSDDDDWQFALRVDANAYLMVYRVQVYICETAGSGTTPPADSALVRQYDTGFSAADTWRLGKDWDSQSIQGEETIQTVGIQLRPSQHGVYAVFGGSATLYVDTLQAENQQADNYDAAIGALIEKPTDIFVHWCEVIGGVAVDTTSLAASLTNLGGDKLAVDMRTLTPGDWKAGLAGLGHLSRANIVPAETASGTVYKMLTAESDYDWPAEDDDITVWKTFAEAGPMEREVRTRHTCLYDFNAATGPGNDRNYEGYLRADEDSSDLASPLDTTGLAAAVDKYGNMAAPTIFLGGINVEATAKDIFGYYVHEAIRAPRLFLFGGCAWWEAYAWEVGDIVSFTHPWSGDTVKARIIGYTKIFRSEANELRCVEVE